MLQLFRASPVEIEIKKTRDTSGTKASSLLVVNKGMLRHER